METTAHNWIPEDWTTYKLQMQARGTFVLASNNLFMTCLNSSGRITLADFASSTAFDLLGSAGAGYAAGLQRRVRRTVMSMQFLQ
jgi:hypothetical protein